MARLARSLTMMSMAERRDIGRYRDAELIGCGGFASVYRAADDDHGRHVAVKVLRGCLGQDERRRFDRERQTMGMLGAHPNIVPVHESGYTEQGEGFLVMELATGGSLRDRLDGSGPIPWTEAVSIITAIASAVQAAHDNGVLHRDIKPDNILIDQFASPKLSDFGIAAVATDATATTSTTTTLAHAAPEILRGRPATGAVDIYALGSTLFNLITGWPPFLQPTDQGVTAMITRALNEPPPDLRAVGVPDAVATAIERSLAKEPDHRHRSPAELASELTAAASQQATAPVGAGATVIASVGGPPPLLSTPTGRSGATVLAGTTYRGVGPVNGSDQLARPPQRGNSGKRGLWLGAAAAVVVLAGIGTLLTAGGGAGSSQRPAKLTGETLKTIEATSSKSDPSGPSSPSSTVAPSSTPGPGPTSSTTSPSSTTSSTLPVEVTPPDPLFTGIEPSEADFSFVWFDGLRYTATAIFDGPTGLLFVDVPDELDPTITVTIVEDLELGRYGEGGWAYYGTNPTFTDGSAVDGYTPDILVLDVGPDQSVGLLQNCGFDGFCVTIEDVQFFQ